VVSAAEKGASVRNAPGGARTNHATRHLQLAAAPETETTAGAAATQTAEVALAVWRLKRATGRVRLPGELAQRAITHYSDRGDLVLAPGRSTALKQAATRGRRALPLEPRARAARAAAPRETTRAAQTVVALCANDHADLILQSIPADARQPQAARLAAKLLPLLKPGGFLALALTDPRDRARRNLGAIVHACQQSGLRYWQHVIVLDPAIGDGSAAKRSDETPRRSRGPAACRAVRCHRDLLIFRRAAAADATPAASVEAGIAA
jgi:hypothetical protein